MNEKECIVCLKEFNHKPYYSDIITDVVDPIDPNKKTDVTIYWCSYFCAFKFNKKKCEQCGSIINPRMFNFGKQLTNDIIKEKVCYKCAILLIGKEGSELK